jgi:hypothetical protein
MKLRAFFFHYNKPASLAQKRNVLTVHWQGACHLVHAIDCRVPIMTRNRTTQPRCVMAGRARSVEVVTLWGVVSAIIS